MVFDRVGASPTTRTMRYFAISETLISDWKEGLHPSLKVSEQVLINLFGWDNYMKVLKEIDDKGSYVHFDNVSMME